jgi:hypothetical protein
MATLGSVSGLDLNNLANSVNAVVTNSNNLATAT